MQNPQLHFHFLEVMQEMVVSRKGVVSAFMFKKGLLLKLDGSIHVFWDLLAAWAVWSNIKTPLLVCPPAGHNDICDRTTRHSIFTALSRSISGVPCDPIQISDAPDKLLGHGLLFNTSVDNYSVDNHFKAVVCFMYTVTRCTVLLHPKM